MKFSWYWMHRFPEIIENNGFGKYNKNMKYRTEELN